MATREDAVTASRLARSAGNSPRVARIPLAWSAERSILVAIVGLSTLVRAAASLSRSTPVLYPDEYVYTQLARGIAATGLPRIRGSLTNFHSVVVPYLVSPTAFIHAVGTAYHAALFEGSFAFSLAAVPAFGLARRVGVSARGALIVALLTVFVPDGAYTSMLLTEPYAYPLFLAVTLLAVESLVAPSARRQIVLLAGFALLVGVRMQFVIVPAAYFAAVLLAVKPPLRIRIRRQAVALVAALSAIVLLLVLGRDRVAGYYSAGLVSRNPESVARWAGVELFVLMIASGWVIIPAGIAGAAQMLRAPLERSRAFVVFTLAVLVGLIGEAGYVSTSEGISHERYVFYAVPLIATIAVHFVESSRVTRLYRSVGYVCVALAIVVPSTAVVHNAMNAQAPTLVGLRALVGASGRLSLVWASALALLMGLVAVRILPLRRTLITALMIQAAIAAAASVDLLNPASLGTARFQPDHSVVLGSPRAVLLGAPRGTALITSTENDNFVLMKVLFWNPSVTRVLATDSATAVDGFPATLVSAVSPRGLTEGRGKLVQGPFAVDQETTAVETPGAPARSVFRRSPGLLFVGLNSADHFLASAAVVYLRSGNQPDSVRMRMVSHTGLKTINVSCPGNRWDVTVGPDPVTVTIPGIVHGVRRCRVSLVRGAAGAYDGRTVSVRVTRLVYIADPSKR